MIIKINGFEISDFIVSDITFNYDSVSDTFSFTVPFFESWAKDKKMYKPLSYPVIEIWSDRNKKKLSRKLLTGYILNHSFKSNASANEISLSGYSKTGILDDCPDVANYQATSTDGKSTCNTGTTLKQLAESLTKPYGIEVVVDELVKTKVETEPYDQVTTDESDTISGHLAKLATFKNVVMRSTPFGQLRFTQIDPKVSPKAHFSTGDGVVNEITMSVNGQSMHSDIILLGATPLVEDKGADAATTGETTKLKNPLVGLFRPTIKKQGAENAKIKDSCKAALADELKNITVTIDCKGWNIIDEDVLTCGDLITIDADSVFLYKKTTLLIRSIQLKEDAKEKKSVLTCVLPETMTGETPKLIFG